MQALRLNKMAFSKTTVGEMVSLLSNDMIFFDYAAPYYAMTLSGPAITIIISYLLWYTVGYAALAGIAALVLLIPFQCKSSN